ncbi:MAG: phosphoribosylaminoimidazolesuccinocarboxamide synthase [Bdellovibrio sp.]|nr:MAG: phosphoribosylaminoimidazolesuccinocarboxamide synthase [Bdellovibrio sp.]
MKNEMIYEGKAKRLYTTDNAGVLLLEFKDSLTAFNAQKRGSFAGKGSINRDVAAHIFKELKKKGIESHFLREVGEREMEVRRVRIIPLEVVVRNVLAGSTAKKMGRDEGEPLPRPLVEFYYKDDALADPFLSDDQAIVLGIATAEQIAILKQKALEINQVLQGLFQAVGIQLIDFKVEFGTPSESEGDIVLADEITPDCCRLWDAKSGERLDKDRFRRDLGRVEESYSEVLKRLTNSSGHRFVPGGR